jgi:hypothetical protein
VNQAAGPPRKAEEEEENERNEIEIKMAWREIKP